MIYDMFNLENKVAIVTGASSGIGKSISLTLAVIILLGPSALPTETPTFFPAAFEIAIKVSPFMILII